MKFIKTIFRKPTLFLLLTALLHSSCGTMLKRDRTPIEAFLPTANTYLTYYVDEGDRTVYMPEKGDHFSLNNKVNIKIYIVQEEKFIYKLYATIQSISEDNLPTDYSRLCMSEGCFDVLLFRKNERTEKDISRLQKEYDTYSREYPYISTHYPEWIVDVSEKMEGMVRITWELWERMDWEVDYCTDDGTCVEVEKW